MEPLHVLVGTATLFILTFAAQTARVWRRIGYCPITVFRHNRLVERIGVYAFSRHPIYTALLGLFTGCFLVLPCPFSAGTLAISLPLLWRITVLEERFLVEHFGEPYREYMRRSGRFLPWF